MDKRVTGYIIRRERLQRDWSQDGLCRGICAASYLSKIEQGRVEASEEVLRLLYQRLGLPWYGGDAALPGLSERIDELYELAYSGEFEKLDDRLSAMEPEREALLLSPAAPDIAVLEAAAAWRGGSGSSQKSRRVTSALAGHISPQSRTCRSRYPLRR